MSTDYERYNKERLERIEGDIAMLRESSSKQNESLYGISLAVERINNTIHRVIDAQEEHAKRLKEIEAISFLSRHWKFIVFTVLTIIVVSLSIHASLKEVIGWLT